MRCSTDGSAGVVLSDLRKDDSPGASGAAPCAIFRTVCYRRSCTRCFGSRGDVVAVCSGVSEQLSKSRTQVPFTRN